MKLLIISDAASGTGFGRAGRELAKRWLAAGVDFRWIAINWAGREGELVRYMQGKPSPESVAGFLQAWNEEPIHERMTSAAVGGDGMGINLTRGALMGTLWRDGWKPDTCFIIADPRAMEQRYATAKAEFQQVRSFNYVPIEGGTLPPCWHTIWEAVTPIAMSDFGARELEKILHRHVESIPHGVSEAFYPITEHRPGVINGRAIRSRAEAKKVLFGGRFAGTQIMLRADRFVPRKNYGALFRIAAPLLEADPARQLIIHCREADEGGIMAELVSHSPQAFEIESSWRHPQMFFTGAHDTFTGIPDDEMNVLYNAADVYVSPTKAEGFGLTLAEAAACGTPVVTTDFAAGPEAVGPGGVVVPVAGYDTNIYGYDWALVDEGAFRDATDELLRDPARREAVGKAGAQYTKRFTWDSAAERILALMS